MASKALRNEKATPRRPSPNSWIPTKEERRQVIAFQHTFSHGGKAEAYVPCGGGLNVQEHLRPGR